ncbi:13714_t:CDS:1, partial [Funneliformis geosporum]
LLEKHPETLRDNIKSLLRNYIFFQDVEKLIKLLKPIKEVIVSLEYKLTSLADCFIQLMKLGIAFKSYPTITNVLFQSYCIDKFNHCWR